MIELPSLLTTAITIVALAHVATAAITAKQRRNMLDTSIPDSQTIMKAQTTGWQRRTSPLAHLPVNRWTQLQKKQFTIDMLTTHACLKAITNVLITSIPAMLINRLLTGTLNTDPNAAALISGLYLALATAVTIRKHRVIDQLTAALIMALNGTSNNGSEPPQGQDPTSM